MKILAIRLKNLASLAGEQVIDFCREPLASAGLFAITGATGAGKSTLLDALCLALFGETPRLKAAGNQARIPDAAGDQETLTSNDGRNLLRRGCSSGYAEVDFVGVDARPYRARWEVRRARERATGRLQASQQSLYDLEAGQLLCTGKQEFQARIEPLLGLNHAQFTRAVLLAQSEFSAFLKASDNERGELLEKLTDSPLYSRLGQAAFHKAREARNALELLEQQLGQRPPLTDETRAQLEQQHSDLSQALEALQHQQETLVQQRQWLLTLQQLDGACQQAEDALQTLEQQYLQEAPQRQQLALLEQLAPVRHAFLQLAGLPAQHAALTQQLQQHQHRVVTLEQQLTQQEQCSEQAQRCWQTAQTMRQQAATPLARAWQLEQQHSALQAACQRSQAQHAAALSAWQHSEQQLVQQHQEAAHLRAQLQQLDGCLQRHSALQPLALAWEGQISQLQQALRLAGRLRQGQQELPALEAAVADGMHQHQQLTAQLQSLLAPLQGISPTAVLAALQAPLHAQRQQLEQFEQALHLLQEYQSLHRQFAEDQQRLQLIDPQIHQCLAEGRQLRVELDEAEQHLQIQQALQERQRLLRSASVEALRSQLQDGQPCAVCGSLEHPYHQQDALLAAFAEADSAALQPLRERIALLNQERGIKLQTLNDLKARGIALTTQQQGRAAQLAHLEQRLQALSIAPDTACAPLQQQQQRLRSEIQQAEQYQRELLTLQQQAQQLQEACHATRQHLQAYQAQLQHQQQQLASDRAALEDIEQAFASLLPDDWLTRWRQDPAATWLRLEPLILEQREAREQYQALQALLGELQTRIAQQQLQRDHHQQILLTLQQQLEEQTEQAADNLTQLRQCLGEQPSARHWQQQLEQTEERARQEAQQQQANLQALQTQLTRAHSERQHLRQRLETLQAEHQQLAAQLDDWRQRLQIRDEHLLAQLLIITPEQLEQQRRRLQHSAQQLAEARARYQERQQQRREHTRQAMPSADPDQLAAMLVELHAQRQQLDKTRSACRAQLLDDDQRRKDSAHLQGAIAAARDEYARWGRISDLIGSADGAAFRRIAQASNLDLLVRHANVQLAQLSRRYRLQRGGSALGLLICDTEMGDELRSVHSLSGGETFLVSLALALGLAAMASSTLQIESLFIDEGFGSLDPESLQLAMDALDSLQAQGRKVGVISHVPEMHERIPVQIRVQRLGNGASRIEVNV